MPASSPAEAVELYRGAVARAVSCLTRAHIDVGSAYARPDVPHPLVMAGGDPVALRGERQLTLSVGEECRVVEGGDGGWVVRTTSYFYAIGQQRAGELFAYHWHPRGRGTVVHPHVHVNADARGDFGWVGKIHLPTGPVALRQVILLAIEELGVMPLRDDWRAVVGDEDRGSQAT